MGAIVLPAPNHARLSSPALLALSSRVLRDFYSSLALVVSGQEGMEPSLWQNPLAAGSRALQHTKDVCACLGVCCPVQTRGHVQTSTS